jgi:prolyl-tRNA synthetase
VVALVLRGDHELNTIKAAALAEVASPLVLAEAAAVNAAAGASPGSVGPLGLDIALIVDRSAAMVADFVCGANQDGHHLTGVNWGRDLPEPTVADLRNVCEGDPSPDGQGSLSIRRGIEVGHIFQLGDKYSKAMNAGVLGESGKLETLTMGCYGIGITRVVAAAIEQNHDERGIIWPAELAPFDIVLIGINHHKSARVTAALLPLYESLQQAGWSVLLDDRVLRPGVMFADADLIGIPHRLVIGERGLDQGIIEYKSRRGSDNEDVALDGILEFLQQRKAG